MYSRIKKTTLLISVIILTATNSLSAQNEGLLNELENQLESTNVYELPAFKALQIANLQSTKIVHKKDFYLVVSHRFGTIKNGIDDFFGLDQAYTKIQFSYGVFDGAQINVSRDSYQKTYTAATKVSLLKQSEKKLVNLVLYGSLDINTLLKKQDYPGLRFGDRLGYSTQLLVSRRFSQKLSLQIAPIFVRQNLVDLNYQKSPMHNFLHIGVGGRYKWTKRMSLNFDYAYNVFSFDITNNGLATNFGKIPNSVYKNPLTIGVDIKTGGHVFQLLFTNARASHDSSFLTETTGDWSKGDISFGFNIVRVF